MYKGLSLTELMKYQIKIKSKYLKWYVYFVSMLRVELCYFEHEVFSAKFLVWFETESHEAQASLQTSVNEGDLERCSYLHLPQAELSVYTIKLASEAGIS